MLFLLDEAGGIPDAVMASAEAALSSCIEGHIVQAGNPTHLEGPLYRACTTERRLWHVTEITADPDDPARATRVKAEWAREQIEKYGRDNPWVLVNVFGKFPPGSLNTLIGPDECREATRRFYRPQDYAEAARVLGVDVARFGDDASVIFPRQGLVAFPPQKYRNLDGTQGAGAVARANGPTGRPTRCSSTTPVAGARRGSTICNGSAARRSASASRRDRTIRATRTSGRRCTSKPCNGVRGGGALPPDCPELIAALSQTTYSFRGDRLLLEPKEQVKSRLGYSPDDADAFVLTFAQPATRGGGYGRRGTPGRVLVDYDPFAEFDRD